MFEQYCKYLCCPDCKSEIKFHFVIAGEEGDDGLLECSVCRSIYPVKDGIPILLRTGSRNVSLELGIFNYLRQKSDKSSLIKKIDTESRKLKKIEFTGSWEWDDVDFWDAQYKKNWLKLNTDDPSFFEKLLPERILQRKKEFSILESDGTFSGNLILEVGAGTATYTRNLLVKRAANDYIAVDMSFYGLKIRRRLLNRANAFFILASIDNLPIKTTSVGCMILIGILHHSEHMEQTLPSLMKLITDNGILYLDEVLYRPSFLSHAHLKRGDNISLHEEYCYREPLMWNINREGVLLYCTTFYTPFYNFAVKKMLKLVIASDSSYKFFRFIDSLIARTIGYLHPSFKAGEISLIWKKNK